MHEKPLQPRWIPHCIVYDLDKLRGEATHLGSKLGHGDNIKNSRWKHLAKLLGSQKGKAKQRKYTGRQAVWAYEAAIVPRIQYPAQFVVFSDDHLGHLHSFCMEHLRPPRMSAKNSAHKLIPGLAGVPHLSAHCLASQGLLTADLTCRNDVFGEIARAAWEHPTSTMKECAHVLSSRASTDFFANPHHDESPRAPDVPNIVNGHTWASDGSVEDGRASFAVASTSSTPQRPLPLVHERGPWVTNWDRVPGGVRAASVPHVRGTIQPGVFCSECKSSDAEAWGLMMQCHMAQVANDEVILHCDNSGALANARSYDKLSWRKRCSATVAPGSEVGVF